ncbi:MAG: threonine-phosphate decarboxylase CobD [Candidatus Bathyarchaeia archaeon]|jgi:threonine-phosphate decarboxylase
MKSALSLAREEIKQLKPCIHGGEIWDIIGKRASSSDKVYDFSSNVNPLGPSPKAIEAIKNSLELISSYPDPDSTNLRDAISRCFKGIRRENVIVGNGSTELIYLFADAFMGKGDVALIPVPTFGEYEKAVRKTGAHPKLVKLGPNFKAEPPIFIREMKGAKAVFICNPNNPTSMLMSRDDVAEIVEEALAADALVFLDEDFIEFVDEEKQFSFAGETKRYPNLFVLRSFTKFLGLTGLRVGYGVAAEDTIKIMSAAKAPWNVNCLAQVAAVAALEDEEHANRTSKLIKTERDFLTCELSKIGVLKVYPAEANFFFIDIRQSGFTAAKLKRKLLGYGVLIRDCTSFAGIDEYYIRVAVKTRRENEKLLEALRKVLGKNGESAKTR